MFVILVIVCLLINPLVWSCLCFVSLTISVPCLSINVILFYRSHKLWNHRPPLPKTQTSIFYRSWNMCPFCIFFLDQNIQSVNASHTRTSGLMAVNSLSLHVEVLVNIVCSKFTKITNLHSSFLCKRPLHY
jgi:hypothetical protein